MGGVLAGVLLGESNGMFVVTLEGGIARNWEMSRGTSRCTCWNFRRVVRRYLRRKIRSALGRAFGWGIPRVNAWNNSRSLTRLNPR